MASGGSPMPAPSTFSRRWATDDVPGMRSVVGERCRSQASAICNGVASSREATRIERVGLHGLEAAEREEGRVGDALAGASVDQLVVGAVGQVVEVLYADDRCDRLRFGELLRRHATDAGGPDEALLPEAPRGRRTVRRSNREIGLKTPPTRRLTISSASSPRCSRFSWTAVISSWRERAGSQDLSASRRAPTFVAMCMPAG